MDNCCIERPENLVWHGICCVISGGSTLFAHNTHIVDRKRLHPPCNLCVEKTNKNRHMAVKPPSPRQALLKRKKAKPLRVRVDGDWYEKAYLRFSIVANAPKTPVSAKKNVELNDDWFFLLLVEIIKHALSQAKCALKQNVVCHDDWWRLICPLIPRGNLR